MPRCWYFNEYFLCLSNWWCHIWRHDKSFSRYHEKQFKRILTIRSCKYIAQYIVQYFFHTRICMEEVFHILLDYVSIIPDHFLLRSRRHPFQVGLERYLFIWGVVLCILISLDASENFEVKEISKLYSKPYRIIHFLYGMEQDVSLSEKLQLLHGTTIMLNE